VEAERVAAAPDRRFTLSWIRTSSRKSPKFLAALTASASALAAAGVAAATVASASPASLSAAQAPAAPAGPAAAARLAPAARPAAATLDVVSLTQRQTAERTAQKLLSHYGWGKRQWTPLYDLWNRESGWNKYATNPYSGAYGIPQAVPGSKMASAGPDWRTNATTQIRWGLGYIKSRYGRPRVAWDHELAYGWY
jgi:hypothetical protein